MLAAHPPSPDQVQSSLTFSFVELSSDTVVLAMRSCAIAPMTWTWTTLYFLFGNTASTNAQKVSCNRGRTAKLPALPIRSNRRSNLGYFLSRSARVGKARPKRSTDRMRKRNPGIIGMSKPVTPIQKVTRPSNMSRRCFKFFPNWSYFRNSSIQPLQSNTWAMFGSRTVPF